MKSDDVDRAIVELEMASLDDSVEALEKAERVLCRLWWQLLWLRLVYCAIFTATGLSVAAVIASFLWLFGVI